MGVKWILLDSARFPKRRKTRKDAKSFQEFPNDFPECIRTNVNQMNNVQESGLRDLEKQMKQAEFASCHLVTINVAIDSFVLK